MITTSIHIPNIALKKLASSVAKIHGKTAPLTFDDFRQHNPERVVASLAYYFSLDFTKTGAIKDFHAHPIKKSVEKYRVNGFEADVSLLGRANYVAKALAKDCAEFLLRRVDEARHRAGERELVTLSDDQLEDVAKEMEELKSRLHYADNDCGTLSEKLKLRLIEREIEIRGAESRHQRLQAIAGNVDFLARTKRLLDAEAEKAMIWHSEGGADSFPFWRAGCDFPGRSEFDQKVIAFRAATGWDV